MDHVHHSNFVLPEDLSNVDREEWIRRQTQAIAELQVDLNNFLTANNHDNTSRTDWFLREMQRHQRGMQRLL
jgi:hypothetical protein